MIVETYESFYSRDSLIMTCDAASEVKLTGEAAVGETEYMTVQKAFDAVFILKGIFTIEDSSMRTDSGEIYNTGRRWIRYSISS